MTKMDRRDYMAMTGGNREPSVEDENGEEIRLPSRYEVCPTCAGHGKHVNPSIDAHGLTTQDFIEDPDFAVDYVNGMYDQPCNECHGLRVIHVVDEEMCSDELLALWHRQQADLAESYAIQEAERSMGA